MITYQQFALALSLVVVAQYAALLAITIRRSRFRDVRAFVRTESVAAHARFIEGPAVTVLLLLAVFTAAAAFVIGSPDYARVAGIAVASTRGALLFLGLWLLGWFWKQRRTWLP